jgi:2-polyprenyl-6-methoxyphenol hydroxylase-like FAD-dependent oxidoreductase
MRADSRDVIIVGGGIAGGALATLLARAGLDVLVLERQLQYRDRVRGEFMAVWGVADAARNGLLESLLGVEGSSVITHKVPFDEVHRPHEARARAVDLTRASADAPGALGLSHPGACAQLAGDAAAAGAEVVFGVTDVAVTMDAGHARVRDVTDGREITHSCRLLVGADGRASAVRQQLGLTLHQTRARTYGAGLLVDGVASWPADTYASGTENDLLFFVFPRRTGVARLYLLHDAREARRFTGAPRRFLEAFNFRCLPGSEEFAAARPVGPCAAFPMNDSWVDDPVVADGAAVLIGDAAGYNDPILGQGLSLAMRDACSLAELLAGSPDWSAARLHRYGEARSERLRRLRFVASLQTDLRCTFGAEGARRRRRAYDLFQEEPSVRLPLVAEILGPDRIPASAFEASAAELILEGRAAVTSG